MCLPGRTRDYGSRVDVADIVSGCEEDADTSTRCCESQPPQSSCDSCGRAGIRTKAGLATRLIQVTRDRCATCCDLTIGGTLAHRHDTTHGIDVRVRALNLEC